MLRPFISLRLLAAFFFMSILSACGGGGGGGGDSETAGAGGAPAPAPVDTPNSYLPTGSHISWTYNGDTPLAFAPAVITNGSHVHSLSYPTGGKEHFVTAADQISLQGLYLPSIIVGDGIIYTGDIRFNQLLAIFRNDWMAGISRAVSGAGTINIAPTYGNRPIDFSGFVTYIGDEAVSTTLGTFIAKRININITLAANIEGAAFSLPYNVTFWLAKDTGIVRRQQGSTTYLLTTVTGIDISGSVSGGGNGTGGPPGNGGGTTTPTGLHVQQSAIARSAVFGSSHHSFVEMLDIVDTSAQWQATVSHPWVSLNKTMGWGNDLIMVTLNTSTLSVGIHQSNITFTNTGNQQQVVVPVTVTVSAPALTANVSTLTFDAAYGWNGVATQQITLSLDTAANSYPVSSSVSFSEPGVITTTPANTLVNQTGQTVTIDIDPANTSGGVRNGQLQFSADINGHVATATVPFTVKASERILYASRDGVAFAHFPTISRLTHDVTVRDSYGLTTTNWSASSDQSWLAVTPGGLTGQTLSLSANPAGLSTETLHQATVTITSSDSHVSGTARIRVALWVGTSDPSAATLPLSYQRIAADPVRPYIYAKKAGGDIDVYNIYNRSLVETIGGIGTDVREIKVSSDGSYLFAHDDAAKNIVRIDLDDTSERMNLPFFDNTTSNPMYSSSGGWEFAYARPAGHPILILDSGAYVDPQTAQVFPSQFTPMFYHTSAIAASGDGRRFCLLDGGLSLFSVRCHGMRYSSLNGGDMQVTTFDEPISNGSDGRDLAVSDDGQLAYVVGSGQSGLRVYSIVQPRLAFQHYLPGWSGAFGYPIAMDLAVDGSIVFGSAHPSLSFDDLLVYNSDGSLRKTMRLSGYSQSILEAQLKVSGDALMMIGLTDDPLISFQRTD